jgi:hypothetical protein
MKSKFLRITACAATLLCAGGAYAQYVAGSQLVSPALAGNTARDAWTTLHAAANPGYPGFPGSAAWPAPIGSNLGGDATLNKVGGSAYPAGSSIYFGGFSSDPNTSGGTLSIQDSTPLAGLANVVFQVEIGEAWTYDFYNDTLPVLSYTTASGTVSNIAATEWTLGSRVDNGTVEMPTGTETVYINSYLLQWDLSSVGESITSFAISFTGVQHAQVYALQLDQSDVYASAVPEPAACAALAGFGALALAVIRRRRAA